MPVSHVKYCTVMFLPLISFTYTREKHINLPRWLTAFFERDTDLCTPDRHSRVCVTILVHTLMGPLWSLTWSVDDEKKQNQGVWLCQNKIREGWSRKNIIRISSLIGYKHSQLKAVVLKQHSQHLRLGGRISKLKYLHSSVSFDLDSHLQTKQEQQDSLAEENEWPMLSFP